MNDNLRQIYTILKAPCNEELVARVQDMLDDGWGLHGYPSITLHSGLWYQAMTRFEKYEEIK